MRNHTVAGPGAAHSALSESYGLPSHFFRPVFLASVFAIFLSGFESAAETAAMNQAPDPNPFTTILSCANTTALRGIPTYESLGLYLDADSLGEAKVRYRVGQGAWQAGFPLVYDGRSIPEVTDFNNGAKYRGSLVHLRPNTVYDVQVLVGNQLYCGTFRTLDDNFPVARTIAIGNRTTALDITQGGTANGYVVYEGGSVGVGEEVSAGITINADYVIVRNTKVSGPQYGIRIESGHHDVVIEGTEITNWGKINTIDAGRLGPSSDYWGFADGGIRIADDAQRITIQRNHIHTPRTDANTWGEFAEMTYHCISQPSTRCHPHGPRGIMGKAGADAIQRVIRYNTIAGTRAHMMEDALSIDAVDSDIYGNYLSGFVDDGSESDGLMRNVRIWGNHIHVISPDGEASQASTGSIFSISPIRIGPTYIWRNLATTDSLIKVMTVKKQTRDDNDQKSQEPNAGRLYFFHNTSRAGGNVSGSGFTINNVHAYNNVLATGGFNGGGINCDFDYNLYTGGSPAQPNGIKATPQFDINSILKAGTPGVNAGVRLPNFNGDDAGSAPDMGYQEAGGAAINVGHTASAPAVAAGKSKDAAIKIANRFVKNRVISNGRFFLEMNVSSGLPLLVVDTQGRSVRRINKNDGEKPTADLRKAPAGLYVVKAEVH